MKIAILEADHVAEELVGEHGDYPHMFKTLFTSVDESVEYEIFTVIDNQFPESLDFDAFLITGSKHSAYEPLPWIEKLKALIVTLTDRSIPLIGICFGHQLIAIALGGDTRKAANGWGVGVYSSELLKVPEWMKTVPESKGFNLLVSHQDQVIDRPIDAQLIASNSFCPNAMMQVGSSILTFQGHPEFSKPYCNALMDKRKTVLGQPVYQAGVRSLEQQEHGGLVAKWILEFIESASVAR